MGQLRAAWRRGDGTRPTAERAPVQAPPLNQSEKGQFETHAQMKTTQPLILAFYPAPAAGPVILRELRRRGLRRSIAVQRSESGSVSAIGSHYLRHRGTIVAIAVAIALLGGLALVQLTPWRGMKTHGSVGALLVGVAIVVAWLIFHLLDVGLEQRVLAALPALGHARRIPRARLTAVSAGASSAGFVATRGVSHNPPRSSSALQLALRGPLLRSSAVNDCPPSR